MLWSGKHPPRMLPDFFQAAGPLFIFKKTGQKMLLRTGSPSPVLFAVGHGSVPPLVCNRDKLSQDFFNAVIIQILIYQGIFYTDLSGNVFSYVLEHKGSCCGLLCTCRK